MLVDLKDIIEEIFKEPALDPNTEGVTPEQIDAAFMRVLEKHRMLTRCPKVFWLPDLLQDYVIDNCECDSIGGKKIEYVVLLLDQYYTREMRTQNFPAAVDNRSYLEWLFSSWE